MVPNVGIKKSKNSTISKFLTHFSFFLVLLLPLTAMSATSTNYQLNQEGTGFTEFSASSSNYQFQSVIGEAINAISSSTNFLVDQGKTWISGSDATTVTILFTLPENRVGSVGTNDDVNFFLTVRTASNSDDVVLFTSGLATTSTDGSYATPIELTGVSAGTYDIGIKGSQHITRILQDVPITEGTNTQLNFTTADYASTTRGSIVMLAGDINGTGATPTTLGDDVVNSVDLSILLPELDQTDPTGNNYRSNLNQDPVINSVDLSVMLDNLDTEGEN